MKFSKIFIVVSIVLTTSGGTFAQNAEVKTFSLDGKSNAIM